MPDEINIDLLISLVEERPTLWDKTLPSYKNRNETKQVWKEICVGLNDNFEELDDDEKDKFGREVMKRWVNIRDAYTKSLKREKSVKKSGGGTTRIRKYIYNEQLQFLSKFFSEHPETETASTSERNTGDKNCETKLKVLQSTQKEFCSRKRKENDFEKKNVKESEDRHISFFKGIIPSLNSFTDDEIIEFQMGTLQLIRNIRQRRIYTQQESPHSDTTASQLSRSAHPFSTSPVSNTSANNYEPLICYNFGPNYNSATNTYYDGHDHGDSQSSNGSRHSFNDSDKDSKSKIKKFSFD